MPYLIDLTFTPNRFTNPVSSDHTIVLDVRSYTVIVIMIGVLLMGSDIKQQEFAGKLNVTEPSFSILCDIFRES